jgi:hypothetical protein
LHTPVEWTDSFPIHPDRFALVAQMIFGSAEDLDRVLQSPARAEAKGDFARLPSFVGSVYHQAAISEEVR